MGVLQAQLVCMREGNTICDEVASFQENEMFIFI